jgi:hypothetical protein
VPSALRVVTVMLVLGLSVLMLKYSMLLVKNLILKNYEFNDVAFVLQVQV